MDEMDRFAAESTANWESLSGRDFIVCLKSFKNLLTL